MAETWLRQVEDGVTHNGELVTHEGEPVTYGATEWTAEAATPETWTEA